VKRAEIITIGDEILIGQIVDTNSAWMAAELNLISVQVVQITSISDSPEHLVSALNDARTRADVVLVTGGLGPTKDDRTKKVLCEYFDAKMVLHQPTLTHIHDFFQRRGLGVNQLNHEQALVPDCCEVLSNPLGTAPGMWFELDDKVIVSMPGVPYEMKEIMTKHVLPRLLANNGVGAIFHKTVLTVGIPESILAEAIEAWENALPTHIHLAYLPNPGQVRLRFSAFGVNEAALADEVATQIEKLKTIIPGSIYGYGNETLAEVLGCMLIDRNETVAAAESCTGGYIAHNITSVPGSSAWFKGSVVAYSNELKVNLLGVNPVSIDSFGAVSEQVVCQMAEGARTEMNSDYAIATSGIAGPDGGSDEKPVGTVWIAIATPKTTFAQKYSFSNNRERNIIRASQTALDMLRLELLHN
jgi:nicotinamide-nucleotide amidase